MADRKGSLMHWTAECGHRMVVYSLEPTPTKCPDCQDEGRKSISNWHSDIRRAETHAAESAIGDVRDWLQENDIELSDEILAELQGIADQCNSAWSELDDAEIRLWTLLNKMPKAERLTMRSA